MPGRRAWGLQTRVKLLRWPWRGMAVCSPAHRSLSLGLPPVSLCHRDPISISLFLHRSLCLCLRPSASASLFAFSLGILCLCASSPVSFHPFTFSNVSPASPVFRAHPALFRLMFLCLFLSPPALSPGPPSLRSPHH